MATADPIIASILAGADLDGIIGHAAEQRRLRLAEGAGSEVLARLWLAISQAARVLKGEL